MTQHRPPSPPSAAPPPAAPSLGRASRMIGAATMLSRLLGLVREQLFASLLGASKYADAFNVGFRIPNLFRDLFAEGALAQAFVPTFKDRLKNHGQADAFAVAARIAATLMVVIGAVILGIAVFAPAVVATIAGSFAATEGKTEMTVTLTRIMLPFLPIVSLAAVLMGMLNAQERYARPALAPAMFNIASVATGLVLYWLDVSARGVVIGWSLGTLLGGLAQLGIQLPPLWRMGFRPLARPDLLLRDASVRRVATLMLPAIGGLAAMQVNVFVNTMFAASEAGAVSWLAYAFRFLQLPIGVFGVAIAAVTTTRYSDAAADRDRPKMASQLTESLRLVLFLTMPTTVGLWILSGPIIQLVFERGRFLPSDTAATAAALDLFLVGLVAYASVKVVAPAFYAIGRSRIPMIASIVAVAVNLGINILLHPHVGYRILAFGTAAAALVNFGWLYFQFQRTVARTHTLALLAYAARVALACGAMGLTTWFARALALKTIGDQGFVERALSTLGPIVLAVLAYAAAAHLLRVPELGHFAGIRRRRRPPDPQP